MKRKIKRKISDDIKFIIKTAFLGLFAGFMSLQIYAQQGIRVSGSVYDDMNELLAGVNVSIKGTSLGTTTDDKGEYTLNVPSDTTTLIFSSVGYQTKEMPVGARRFIMVILKEETENIGEVTIVAFGTQKKESVIGSITTIDPKELKIPASNLTTALAGRMAGIIAYQRGGEPGKDNADFFVRGITTFGTNSNPLILIDGIELTSDDLARLQPDDIASFSIMKDATATALYGARGANGVVFVTTKQGSEGPAKISVRLENTVSMPTKNIEFADPVTFMKLANEAVRTRNPLGELLYSQEKIENTLKPGANPLFFPANDWRKLLFKDYAMNQRANLSVSGGGSVANYFVSGSYNKDHGVLKVDRTANFNNNVDFTNYSLRANVNVSITKTTQLAVRLNGNFSSYNGPIDGGGASVYNAVVHSNPVLFPIYFPKDEEHKHVDHIMFGNRDNNYRNPYAQMVRGYAEESRGQMLAQVEAKQNLKFITEGLSIRSMVNISRLASFNMNRSYTPFWYQLDYFDSFTGEYRLTQTNKDGTEYLTFNEGAKNVEATLYSETMLNYGRTFSKHSLSGLLVFMTRDYLTANAGSIQLSLPSRNLGLSGRATYSYNNRYFAEFNFGYNGSERFSKEHRFGFFPSAGVAWMVSNEKFWEPLKPVINNFKLRYSYGLVGNDNIGSRAERFFYLSEVNMNATDKAARFGTDMNKGPMEGSNQNGISTIRYENQDISWEISTKQNYAMEISLWNKLNIIAEYFREYRKNILMSRQYIPSTMGLSAGISANVGEASGQGVDVSLDFQQSWNTGFWASARVNFTYATSKYEKYEELDYKEPWRSLVGRSVSKLDDGGYIAERLFMDDAEALNSPTQRNFGGAYGGGDIKYTDVNRDGEITVADIVPMGYPKVPEIVYGFGLSAGYKGFDVSFFFQGAAHESFWINQAATSPFQDQTQLLKVYADSHWSEENQDLYALWPRLSPIVVQNNIPGSNWWLRSGAFLRLKQAEIGYTIPGKWQQQLHISGLRVYLNGSNLFLLSNFKLWDVEMAGNGLGYPIQRVVNIGVNFSFN
ncbi:MAG: TonB-dependent receptor [Prevotellaceae bacterium]|jgi:TonB-linked SusC/RagA family outer membrane protein|nr:TonB-dependent receptor [Prevotellaceae bacterium]